MGEKMITGGGVGVLVLKEGKVLLGLRNSDPIKASSAMHGEGTWTMPGGKLSFGQGFEQAAARELQEETSLIAHSFKLISLSNDIVPDAHFITVGLLCDDFSGEVKTMEPEEIVEWKWFDLNNLPSNIFPPSKKMAQNYLSGKIYQTV